MKWSPLRNVQVKVKVQKSSWVYRLESRNHHPPKETLSLNNHLQSNSETKHPIENDRTSTHFLEDQASSSVIFNENQLLVLTKSSFRVISYISFEQHIKTFSEIDNLLQATVDQTNTYMQTKSFPPYYRQLPGESQLVQERKDQWIQVQLQELSYELHLVMRNFELIKGRFLENYRTNAYLFR